MTNKKYIRDLYRQSLKEKWDLPIEDIDMFHYCPFCDDVRHGVNGVCSVDGHGCGEKCLIDKKICGSEGSLMDKLGDFYEQMDYDIPYPPEYIEMVEKVKKALEKHTKKRIFKN